MVSLNQGKWNKKPSKANHEKFQDFNKYFTMQHNSPGDGLKQQKTLH
jgi:hypothetical protein